MVNQTKGFHHFQKRRSSGEFKGIYDKFMYLIVILAPLTNIPQLLKIWIEKDASGVSTSSWFMFTGISIAWFFYGILHKDKHILLMNAALMVVQILIAIGSVVYG